MNWKLVVIAVVCLLGLAAAQVPWGGESERSRAQVYALEGLGALGGVHAQQAAVVRRLVWL
jgi:hypothetical protein